MCRAVNLSHVRSMYITNEHTHMDTCTLPATAVTDFCTNCLLKLCYTSVSHGAQFRLMV